jgi:drug/metabolite transporter, DME family
MALFAGGGFAALTLVNAREVPGRHVIASFGLLLGGVLLVPFGMWGGMSLALDGHVVLLLLYLGLVPTAVAYGAYFLGLRHAQPTAAALAIMLEPLTATLLAVGFYGERLGLAGTLGTVLIAGALLVYYLK